MTSLLQPFDLAYAPPRYPRHAYEGPGVIVVVRAGGEVAGYLTRQGDAIGWLADAPPDAPAGIVRRFVSEALRLGAYDGRPLDDVWREILDHTQHDPPVLAPLDGLQG